MLCELTKEEKEVEIQARMIAWTRRTKSSLHCLTPGHGYVGFRHSLVQRTEGCKLGSEL